jgi:hypothetical protein
MATKKWYNFEDWEKKHGPMTFGRFVKAFREADDTSQTDYAKKLGVTFALAAKIAKAMGVSELAMIQLAIEDQLRREKMPYRVELKSA